MHANVYTHTYIRRERESKHTHASDGFGARQKKENDNSVDRRERRDRGNR